MGQELGHFDRTIHALFSSFLFKIVAKRNFLVARLQNQLGPCSKVFKIISWNLIQKRTEFQKEKQNKHNI